MRNLTKVLALVLALTMMVSVAGFAKTYSDVEVGANYEEAVSVLSDLGLVKGYDDGTFGADKTLTRAEGTAFVLRLMGLEEAAISAKGTETGFTDVPADHWASGYVYVAAQNGVVAGMGDGTFEPDTELTYAQIVKMIVVALGYYPLASELGEWPGNYISAGTQIKLTTGIAGKADEAVTRATTARLLYAALTIPKMEKDGVGVSASWKAGNTMVLDDLGIYKLKTTLTNVYVTEGKATIDTAIAAGADKYTNAKQCLAISGKYTETKVEDKWTFSPKSGKYDVAAALDLRALKDLENIPAIVYVADDGSDLTIVSVVKESGVDSITINSGDYKANSLTNANKITYYTNAEQTKTATLTLARTMNVRVNGAVVDAAMPVATFENNYLGDSYNYAIELVDADGNTGYEQANVTEYVYMVVKEVKKTNSGVYTITSEDLDVNATRTTIKVDTEDDDTAIVIVKDGEEITVDQIAEGDILNIVAPAGGIVSNLVNEATIYVTNDVVEGTVQYNDTEDDVIVMTDGSEYSHILTNGDTAIKSQSEGSFYLNILGEIIYVDDEVVKSTYNYGFVTTLTLNGRSGNFKSGEVRMLTTEGEWVTLDTASSVTFDDDTSATKIADIVEANSGNVARVSTQFNADRIYVNTYDSSVEYIFNTVVAYKTNSSGAVKEMIYKVATIDSDVETARDYSGKKYRVSEDGNTYGSYNVTEDTVVYAYSSVPVSTVVLDETKISVKDMSILKDDKTYGDTTPGSTDKVAVYAVNDKTDNIGIMFGQFEADVNYESPFFIVTKVYDTTIEEEKEVTALVGYLSGVQKTYYYSTDDESKIYGTEAGTVGGVANTAVPTSAEITPAKLDVLVVSADANGIINKAAKIWNIGSFSDDEHFVMPQAVNGMNIDGDDDGKFVTGFVANKKSSRIYLDTSATNFDVDTESVLENLTEVTSTKNTVVTVYDFTVADAYKVAEGTTGNIENGTMLIGRVNDENKLVEVIVIRNKATDDQSGWIA